MKSFGAFFVSFLAGLVFFALLTALSLAAVFGFRLRL